MHYQSCNGVSRASKVHRTRVGVSPAVKVHQSVISKEKGEKEEENSQSVSSLLSIGVNVSSSPLVQHVSV